MRKNKKFVLENIVINNLGAKGVGIGKTPEGKTVLVTQAIPGDIVNVQISKSKKKYLEGKIIELKEPSKLRIKPKCKHFGTCGGCKWQNLSYTEQINFKEKEVTENIKRIAGINNFEIIPILKCEQEFYYRNKLEYSFSNARWMTLEEIQTEQEIPNKNALGFHIPSMWSKVLQIEECFLQNDPSNQIRNEVYKFCIENNFEFFDLKNQTGLIRQMMIRSNEKNEFMVLFQFISDDKQKIETLLNHLKNTFQEITNLGYTINNGMNDIWYDLDIKMLYGKGYLIQEMEGLQFKVHPKSFFQTNSKQALNLYKITREFAQLSGNELVYDLYTGTGTIAQFVAKQAKKVIGIESVPDAIKAAKQSAIDNNINNCEFICGDMKDAFSQELIEIHGSPDVIITDPPRDGMHQKVVNFILNLRPKRIVYVSCNSATQARDLDLLKNDYQLIKIQAVDMFPQTHHVESVALLELK